MVLLVSLILLLMLTLIAITASNQATLQLRISSNSEQRNMAFQAAEAGISNWTAAYLSKQATLPSTGTIGATQFNIAGDKSRWDVPCPGSGLTQGSPQMDCFDLTVEGESVCDGGTCAVTTSHRQGGQRRGEIL